jgi:hypothetical protein
MDKIVSGNRVNDTLAFLHSLTLVGLGLLGMAGVLYHALAPEGWFTGWLGRVWSQHPALAFLVLVGLLTMTLAAHNQVGGKRYDQGSNEIPFYLFIGFGMFFAGRLIVYGTL